MNRAVSTASHTFLQQTDSPYEGSENDGLILSDIDSQMARLRSKYPTSEADYLAAARERNTAKAGSVNEGATDSDWHQAAAEARQRQGTIDDWENAVGEAGNVDSQILIPTDMIPGDGSPGDSDDPQEPKLLLF
jgi:hypothetical protein